MHVKSIVSALALSAALAVSGPAFAQTMFNGTELSADDLGAVTERCEQLTNSAATEPLVGTEQSSDDTSGESATGTATSSTDASTTTSDGATDATVDEAPDVSGNTQATTTIDLATITVEQCTEAGLGGAM